MNCDAFGVFALVGAIILVIVVISDEWDRKIPR